MPNILTKQWLRGVVRETLTFNRTAIEAGHALRCTAAVASALVIGHLLGGTAAATTAATGAFLCGFASLQGIYRSRMLSIVATSIGIAFASIAGTLSAHVLITLVLGTAVVGYLYGTLAQLSRMAGIVALNSTIGFIVFSSTALAPLPSLEQAGLLMAGGLLQGVLLIAVWPFSRLSLERRGLAAAYRQLADYAGSPASAPDAVPPMSALIAARQILADPQPFARSRDVARFERLLQDAEVLRNRIGALHALRPATGTDVSGASEPLLAAIAMHVRALSEMLAGGAGTAEVDATRERAIAAFENYERAADNAMVGVSVARDIAARLRDATQGVTAVATGSLSRISLSAVPRPNAYVQTRIDRRSRDALRIALVLSTAMFVGHASIFGSRGYWIPLTAAWVLQPDLRSTVIRGFGRIGGTLLGALAAAGAAFAAHGDAARIELELVLAAAVCYLTLLANYAIFTMSVTAFVVLFIASAGLPSFESITPRVIDTLIGGLLAIAGYLLLPTWAHRRARTVLADLIDGQCAFAAAVLDAFIDGGEADLARLELLRTRVWKTRTNAESLIDQMRAERERTDLLDTRRALDILGATQSFALVNFALEGALTAQSTRPAMTPLRAFRDELEGCGAAVATALREQRAAEPVEQLRRRYAELVLPQADDSATARLVYARLNGYVQSIETLASLCRLPIS